MSETSILPGASPADGGIDMVPPAAGADETPAGGDRRRLMIIGAVVGLLVVVAAAYLLLHKSSSGSSDNTFVPHSSHPATQTHAGGTGKATTPSAGKPKGGSTPTLPKKAHRPQVRDPFKPLIVAPVAGAAGATTTTTVAAPSPQPTTPTGTTPGTVPVAPVPQPSSGPTTTTGHGTTVGSPQWIQLMSVHGDRATFRVGYAHHKFRRFIVQAPKAASSRGTLFDKVFALIGIQDGEVTLQVGDNTPFDLKAGVAHSV